MTSRKKQILFEILSDLLFLLATATLFAVRWARRNYPMDNCYTVFFVMSSDTSGHDSGTGLSILFGFVIPAIISFIIYRFCLFVLKKRFEKLSEKFINFVCLSYFIVSVVICICYLKAWNYPRIYYEIHKAPVDSLFYKENYVKPEIVKVPENKRNLIYIFMESMESSYQTVEDGGVLPVDPMPYLHSLAKENINFSENEEIGGGYNIEGTCWTVGGLLSKTSGLPYYNPFVKKDGKLTCLPNAVFLGDILKENGYNAIFSIGSEKQFENRDTVMENHGYEIHDIKWYKKNGLLDPDYQVFWGFEDQKLYELAKKELDDLSSKDKPFLFTMLTVDTHFPHGFKCSSCSNLYEEQMMNVLCCADNLLKNFIEWAKTQDWYSNTEIVIVGDHNYLDAPMNNFMNDVSPLSKSDVASRRRFMNVFINPEVQIEKGMQKNRKFSSFDIMPTILESMGFILNDHSAALGRSLYSDKETMIEKYGSDTVNQETMKRTKQYDALND